MHLVHELGLEDGVDTLGRWLAHHLAELIEKAKKGKTTSARRAATAQAVDLILKLWKRRAELPGNANPLASYKELLAALKALSPSASPWQVRTGNRTQVLAAKIHDRACQLANLILIDSLPRNKRPQRVPTIAASFLSDGERKTLKGIDQWLRALAVDAQDVLEEEKKDSRSKKQDAPEQLLNLTDEAIGLLKELRDLLSGKCTEDASNKAAPNVD